MLKIKRLVLFVLFAVAEPITFCIGSTSSKEYHAFQRKAFLFIYNLCLQSKMDKESLIRCFVMFYREFKLLAVLLCAVSGFFAHYRLTDVERDC